jgi:CBS domain-containing protein
MDGGRVLRALLEIGQVPNATLIASRLSQVLSVIFAVLAIWSSRFDLLLVSIVVFLGASQEHFQAQTRRAVRGKRVQDAMIESHRIEAFSHGTTLSQALTSALKSLQEFFPVTYNGQLLGIVDKRDLLDYAARGEPDSYIAEVVSREYHTVKPADDLAVVLELPGSDESEYFVVMDDGVFRGMLLKEKLIEFLLVDDLRKRIGQAQHVDEYPSI